MNDTISRKAALDVLRTCYDTEKITYTYGDEYIDEYIDYNRAVDMMEVLPSTEPERKKGLWIKWGAEVKCSQCDLCNPVEKPFCPNCGAEMRGEQDG